MIKKYFLIVAILVLAAVLRIYLLDKYPAGLNADEAAIGYNAWSLLETGKDEHGESWPMVFRSFDDYKPPVYFYLVLPFVKVLGLNIWSVRLPSALLGVASVLLIYLLAKRFLPNNKFFPYFSALLLAISPWHLHFSRGGWEVNAALFFILLGIWAFFRGLEKPKFFYLFVTSLVVSLYAYHSARILSPLLALTLISIYWKDLGFPSLRAKRGNLTPSVKTFFIACTLGIVLSLPLAGQLLSKEGQSRFSGVSVFSDTGPLWQALEMRRQHDSENFLTKSLHNRYLSYGLRFTKNYLSHFSPRFLFVRGDEIARSQVPEMGQSYLFLFPFYLLGLFSLLKLDSKEKIFIFTWFLLAPLAAALTFQSPHALRSQNMVIPLTLISALGLSVLFKFLSRSKTQTVSLIMATAIFIAGSYSLARYLHLYYVHYPKVLPFAWQYGFDQIANYVKDNGGSYDQIIISDRYDQPYILMAFFLQYPPEKMQDELVMTPRDKFGFSTARELNNMRFRSINYDQDKKLPKTLIISADEPVDDKAVIHTVYDLSGKPMYKFIATK